MVSVSFTARLLLFCSNLLFPSRNSFRLIFQLINSWSFWAHCCRGCLLGSQADWCRVYGLNSFAIYILVIVCLCIQSHTINLSYNVLSYSISLFTLPYKISLHFILMIQKMSYLSSSLYHSLAFSSTFLKTKFCNYFICRNS